MELELKLSTENIHSRLDRERMEVRKSVDVSPLFCRIKGDLDLQHVLLFDSMAVMPDH